LTGKNLEIQKVEKEKKCRFGAAAQKIKDLLLREKKKFVLVRSFFFILRSFSFNGFRLFNVTSVHRKL
jgi:hypothetical protein